MKIKNPYALINDELVHISDEKIKSTNGEKYVCPDKYCDNLLYAKKGSIRAHHFAHKSGIACNGLESALHLKAKEVIEQIEVLTIPKYRVWPFDIIEYFQKEIFEIEDKFEYSLYSKEFINYLKWSNWFDFDEFYLFDDVELELKNYEIESEILLENVKPDIRLKNKKTGKSLYIEIAVTSFVTEEKEKLIKEKNLSVLEIDLSKFYKSEEYSSNDSKDLESFLKATFKYGRKLNSENVYYYRGASFKWINLRDFNKFLELKRYKFIKICQNKVFRINEFYNKEFIPMAKSLNNVLHLNSNKDLINELNFWDYEDIMTNLKSDVVIDHLRKMYMKTDLYKKREEKDLEKESLKDFIKRMTS